MFERPSAVQTGADRTCRDVIVTHFQRNHRSKNGRLGIAPLSGLIRPIRRFDQADPSLNIW